MLWFALLIPCVFVIIAYVIWHKAFHWGEVFIPFGASLVFIVASYFILKSVSMRDVEYNGYTVVEARYYEPWETWVKKTCSYTTCSGSGKTRVCTTHYYDCSYCDYHGPQWEAIDEAGNRYSISEAKYKQLIKRWSATEKFVELGRRIVHHGSCGKDGDMYSIRWDFKIETSEASTIIVPFENIVKVSHSAFKYPDMTSEEAKAYGLYEYPELYDFYHQPAILGMDSFANKIDKQTTQTLLEYLNGYLGPRKKVRVFTLLYRNKPIDIAFKQEQYWEGGNQNEVVVCIGLNDTMGIQWVRPFSWCDNKRVCVDIREDVAELKKFQAKPIFFAYKHSIERNFHYKSFEDFNYLTFEPTGGQRAFVYGLTLLITILTIWWCVKNDIDSDS